jgi:hypothetical protein
MKTKYRLKDKVWEYPGMAGWHFISIPKKEAASIKKDFHSFKRGWGSLPVKVTLGKQIWKTSIFWDNKLNTYLLPLKAEIRKKEMVKAGDTIVFLLEIRSSEIL